LSVGVLIRSQDDTAHSTLQIPDLACHAADYLVLVLHQPEHIGEKSFLGPHITPDISLLKKQGQGGSLKT
jgi:hypothetical protein